MKKNNRMMALLTALTLSCCTLGSCAARNTEIHVSTAGSDTEGNGSVEKPYATIECALTHIRPGVTVILHEGTYTPFTVNAEASGTANAPVVIRSANGERAVIQGEDGEKSVTVQLINVDHFTLQGLEISGGAFGIYYMSTSEQGNRALEDITIAECKVHDILGTHGICVYATNDLAPVRNLIMRDCEVYRCRCDSSESTVFNGNIDGFTICNNIIHDNNNIGIDMIGFEGNAAHNADYQGNKYDVDYVRNGKCYGNVVYNISAFDNQAYWYKGDYDLCADGIYVDGGQNIEIYNNFIFNCDIGIEIATEHSPDDNPLFHVSGIDVHDNVIAHCNGWCGLAFGGYDKDLGFTENCKFHNNTFIENDAQIGVQRSRDNNVYNNIAVGGESGIDFNTDCRETELVNDFGENLWCADDSTDYFYSGKYDLNTVLPNVAQQKFFNNSSDLINGFSSMQEGFGSQFEPEADSKAVYNAYLTDGLSGIAESEQALLRIAGDGISIQAVRSEGYDNICEFLNQQLKESGINTASVEVMKVVGGNCICVKRGRSNGHIQSDMDCQEVTLELHLRYSYAENTWTNAWIKDVKVIP